MKVPAAGAIVAAAWLAACGDSVDDVGDPTSDVEDAAAEADAAATTVAEETTTTTTVPELPNPEDFELHVTVLEKQCFGSAGCNITYVIDPTYADLQPLDPDGPSFQVVYEVHGGHDPQIGRFVVEGDEGFDFGDEYISTPSADSELTAEPIEVRPYP